MCNNRERRQRRPRASAETPVQSDTNIPPTVWDPACPEWLRHECRLVWPAADCSTSCQDDHTNYNRPPVRRPKPQPVTTPAEHLAPRPLPSRGHRWGWWPGIVMYTVLFLSLVSPGLSLSPSAGVNSVQETGVCTSMDIRNSPENLRRLSGCRVIEGFLQIVLMDNSDEAAFENVTFPELREITGYLMLFRAYGLQSLGKLFPNLAVIRGQDLFNNYALVVYECRSMKELGLHSLTDITRGGVRLEKNNNMCYVKTIDWNLIAPNAPVGHYFKENRAENECPVCPGDDGVHEGGMVCPEAPDQSPFSNNKKHLCWNKEHCQKVCKKECGNSTCSSDGRCCDESCLGGCTGSLTNCTVCRDLSIGDYKDRKCIKECPNNTLRHYKRRCITEAQCRSLPSPKGINTPELPKFPFKPFNGTCTKDCPHGYDEKEERGLLSCIPCKGPCKKVCSTAKLDSIEAIQKMKGCTHIVGSLSIESIKGGVSVVKELEEGVGLIEEITGTLKIVRCFPLVSLNFFKRLKVIGGEITDLSANASGVYSSFIVNDNQNLQELWDWDKHGPIEIRKGELFFHLNPKLCLEKIDPLKTMARETKFSPMEIVRNSNGDKVACNVTLLSVTVATRTHVSVLFTWPSFQLGDERALLGYVMHSIEAPHQNITFFDGRDACRNDGWKLDDVPATRASDVFGFLTHLKPYTQYAVYVKTETISTERQGAQSNITYVRTLPGQPSQPKIDKLVPLSPDTLMLSWSPPDHPNGNITMYKILVQWEEDDEDYFRQRNYCYEPLEPPEEKKIDIEEDLPPRQTPDTTQIDGKCPCQPPSITKDDDEAIGDISFENQLHNQVYFKKQDLPPDNETRRRRDLEAAKRRWTRNASGFPLQEVNEQKPPMQETKTQMDPSGVYNVYVVEVGPQQRSINITHLRHFASHMVSIWACREIEKDETGNNGNNDTEPNCSIDIVKSERTLKLDGADEITKLRVRVLQANQSLGVARLEWMEPEKPNGPIVTYTISYNRLDIENHRAVKECITRAQFTNGSNSYIIKGLNPGNYSVKVMATSLAGDGNYSAEKYFYIESSGNNNTSVILAVVGSVFVALLVMGAAYFIHRRYFAPPTFAPTKIIASVNPEYVSSEYVPDEWEVSREKVQLIKELGQGAFGMVYEGIAKDINKDGPSEMRCAVKTINEHATDRERIEFLKEASVMKAFDTAHVVRLLGVVSRGQPTFVVMELMANGDLKSYLRSHRPDAEKPRNAQPPPLSRLLQMAMEIADGMSYLSAKKFVHRDLAARNCMVAEDLTVKVGDFGMTRDIYETDYYRKGSKGLLPVRWMSPESLKDGVFTSSSDVWSYGVVLWEMATLASQPYQGLSNDQVLRYVIDGGVMERPENCPDRLYQLMQLTWHHRAFERPTFLQLVSLLVGDASPLFRETSFFYSTQGQEMLHQSHPQQPGVSEEPAASTSGDGLPSWSRVLNSIASDSSPPPSPRPSPASASYRDVMRLVPFGERARAAPHETEALVNLSHSAPPPKVSPPQSSSQSNAPNGYLPRSGNNGNPSSLNTSRC